MNHDALPTIPVTVDTIPVLLTPETLVFTIIDVAETHNDLLLPPPVCPIRTTQDDTNLPSTPKTVTDIPPVTPAFVRTADDSAATS